MSKREALEVSDSTDWLETPLRSVAAVDSALRCQVCKDFYTTPMITSCSHTFCSLCIRRCLNNDGKCPACRTVDQELRLRFNGAVEELVEAFKTARPEIFALAKKSVNSGVTSPKRSREDLQLDDDEKPPPRKRTRSSRITRATQEVYVVDSDLDDGDFVPEEGCVQCPICNKQVKQETINTHIDRGCADEPPTRRNEKSTFPISPSKSLQNLTKRPERLAQLHYSMVKDNALRKKLADLGLPAGGTRQGMERRYTEWVTLWNANCDATHPKGKTELKRELDTWERTQGSRAQATSSLNPGAQIRDRDFDKAAWSTQHDGSFKELIANARSKVRAKAATPDSPSRPTPPLEPPVTPIRGAGNPLKSQGPANVSMMEAGGEEQDEHHPDQQPDAVNVVGMTPFSKSRFFDEPGLSNPTSQAPTSQYSNSIPIFEKEKDIDITTITNPQP
ncbi:uncharacterized protein BP5553_04350 [Venustampulla echinocandica]|uniref:Postreplication repair E3 ubiquitin-protein ligase RAD18 n=1 Tax=Venustampulla echinocandica TaxID=2656787 RepID=A0A370TWV9_9HELO|nr:uncharacterized protein BP5553_04350 [Venustampulla echinocandica]RDL40010.1 hypothetical protein BP5553_04350 [Venustampulla echinocandica]